MAKNKNKAVAAQPVAVTPAKNFDARGFYRPEQYVGPWAILPDRLTTYLSFVNKLDLNMLAAAAADKRAAIAAMLSTATSPSEDLPTQNPDEPKKDDEKKDDEKPDSRAKLLADLDELKKEQSELNDEIKQAEEDLNKKKEDKSEQDEKAIKQAEEDLKEKKEQCDKLQKAIDDLTSKVNAADDDDASPAEEKAEDEEKKPEDDTKKEESEDDEDEEKKPQASAIRADAGGAVARKSDYAMIGDTAVITLAGPITKHPTSFSDAIGGASTVQTRRAIRQANADSTVERICLLFDSPGGTVAGVQELMDEVKLSSKPIWSYAEDMCASAAYFIASQTGFIASNPAALVGSIGTLVVMQDTSGMYAKNGIVMHVLSTGKWKGVGMDGKEITDEHVEHLQTMVDQVNALFSPVVMESRKLTPEARTEVKEGGVYIASEAMKLGLVDAVMSFDDFLSKFEASTGTASVNQKAYAEGQAAAALFYKQMLAAVDNDAELASRMFLAGKSINAAREAKSTALKAELAMLKATGADADAGQKKPVDIGAKKSSDTAENEFMSLVREEQKKTGKTARDAMSVITARHPEIYKEYQATFTRIEEVSTGNAPEGAK